jgi:hypothetical protein
MRDCHSIAGRVRSDGRVVVARLVASGETENVEISLALVNPSGVIQRPFER